MTNKNTLRSVLVLAASVVAVPSIAEVVITGSRVMRDRTEVPVPIVSLAREDIEAAGLENVGDLLERLPVGGAVDTQRTGGPLPSLRGFRLSPEQTLVLLNGTRVPDQSLANAFPGIAIEEVEIIEGGARAEYGSGAVAGIVNVIPRDGIEPVDVGNAYQLGTAQMLLGNTRLSVQSNKYCDATNGILARPWAYFPSHDFSSRYMGEFGGVYGWTLDEPTIVDPATAEPPTGTTDTAAPTATHAQLQALTQRIADESNLTEWQRSVLQARLILGSTMAPAFFSDAAFDAGLFDPTRVYQQLLAGTTASAGTGESPGNVTWGPGEVAPFDLFPYPAASEFDFSLCSDEQRVEVLRLIGERNGHRAERSVIMDRLYYEYVSDATYSDVTEAARKEEDARDEINRALKAYWLSCVEPATSADSQTAQAVESPSATTPAASATEEPVLDDTDDGGQVTDAPTQASSEAGLTPLEEIIVTGILGGSSRNRTSTVPANPDGGGGYTMGRLHPWSLDVRFYNYRIGDDGNRMREGVSGLAVGAHPFVFDEMFGLPLTDGGSRDTETGHDQSPQTQFTDANGVARFCAGGSCGDSSDETWDVGTTAFIDSDGDGVSDEARALIRRRLLDVGPRDADQDLTSYDLRVGGGDPSDTWTWSSYRSSQRRLPAGPLGWAFGYERREEAFEFAPDRSTSDAAIDASGPWFSSITIDELLALDLAIDNSTLYGGPRIWAQFPIAESDSIYQVFPGMGGRGRSFFDLPAETRDSIPDGFNLAMGYSLNDNFVLTYNYDQNKGLDLGTLNDVNGQGGWGNDFCGDKALPPEGVGYASAEMSPVKSVDDRWALAHVGLGEPLQSEDAGPIVVGIIDTGLDWNHLDFAWDNLWRNEGEIPDNGIDDDNNGYVDDIIGWDFMAQSNSPWDYDGHGTFVAGLIAATNGNDVGIDGANPSAKIMVLKALNNHGRTRASYIAQAIIYGVDNGARILNLSASGPGFPRIVQDAVDYAVANGVLVVMAAGNRAEDVDRAKPARLRGVMTVAATGPDEKRTAFSNVGSALNVAAPGVDVVSLRARTTDTMYNSAETSYVPGDAYLGDDNRYYRATGTSFSSAIATGVASVVLSERPELTLAELKRVIEQSARDVETPGRDRFTGYGIVDAKAALEADPAFYIYADIPDVRRLDADGQSYLQVVGVADADEFARATLDIGSGEDPGSWTATGPVILDRLPLGELGRIPSAELEGAETWTVRLTVEHANGRKREARYVVDLR